MDIAFGFRGMTKVKEKYMFFSSQLFGDRHETCLNT